MQRDHARSQQSLKVRAHDLLDTVDLRESCQSCPVRLSCAFAVGAQSLNRNVQANLVAVLEAIGDRFFRRIDLHKNIVNRNQGDPSAKRRLGIPEDPERDAINLRNLRVTGQRDVDSVGNLGGQPVMCQGRDKANDGPWNPDRDWHQVRA
jgi:hypothetical protein